METVVRLVDETPSGVRTEALTLRLVGSQVTVRELVRHRVEAESVLRSVAPDGQTGWRALVEPGVQALFDAEEHLRIVLAAIQRHALFVIVGDRHVGLDDAVPVVDGGTVHFLRMMPLVGS